MTDILEQLREHKQLGNGLSLPPTDLEVEAADEIERLREEIKQLKAAIAHKAVSQ